MPTPETTALRGLVRHGALRVAINLGNPVLAQRDPETGALGGVSVALARELARRLACRLELKPYDAAGEVTADRRRDGWDIAFLAVDPQRAAEIAFTPPYVTIEGVCLVAPGVEGDSLEALDRPGVRIAVGRGAAYELYLGRTVARAELVRFDTSAAALAGFVEQGLEAAAGVRQPVAAFAARHPSTRLVEPAFMRIAQAMAMAPGDPAALAALTRFLETMKAEGVVARALAASGQDPSLASS